MKEERVALGEVVDEFVDQGGPVSREFVYIDISSIDRDTKSITNPKVLEKSKAPSRAKQRLKHGDVLVSMTRPNLNAVALVTKELDDSIGSTGFHVLRSKWVDSKFLFYLVQTREFIDDMSLRVQGALYPAVRPKDISSYIFLFPSSLTQRRIVAKIEALFSELDKGVEALKTAREQLKVYRQAVLKHAFEGKLTAKWREENKDKLESPERLLARIQQEREARYQQQLAEWKVAVKEGEAKGKEGRKPGRPRKPELVDVDRKSLPELPKEWTWEYVGNLNADVFDGPFGSNLKTSDYVDDGVRVIRLENIG
jgi:type I restriction enzyme S subunit